MYISYMSAMTRTVNKKIKLIMKCPFTLTVSQHETLIIYLAKKGWVVHKICQPQSVGFYICIGEEIYLSKQFRQTVDVVTSLTNKINIYASVQSTARNHNQKECIIFVGHDLINICNNVQVYHDQYDIWSIVINLLVPNFFLIAFQNIF